MRTCFSCIHCDVCNGYCPTGAKDCCYYSKQKDIEDYMTQVINIHISKNCPQNIVININSEV